MYDDFSYVYDKLGYDIPYEFYANNIKKLIKKENIKKDSLLELACGTGNLTKYFFDEFKQIDGLDLSKKMLEIFSYKHKKENVNLFNYDMVEFVNENSYDLIVILLDSINYVLDKKDLEKLFTNCYKNLKKDGLLIFDINSEYKMREIFGNNSYIYEYEDIFYSWDNFLEDDLVDMNLNFFIEKENGLYERIEEFQTQRIYTKKYIKDLVKKIGFKDIESYDEDKFAKESEKTLRILFKASKKG